MRYAEILTAGIPDTVYHRGDSLSASGAKKLLELPARFKYDRDNPPASTPTFDFGRLAHKLILGEGGEFAVLDPAVHGLKRDGTIADSPTSTTAWKQAAAEARENGQTPVSVDDWDRATVIRDSVMAHPLAGRLFAEGEPELSGQWIDEQTGVRCRFRPDHMTTLDGEALCVDLKTTADANPAEWYRAVVRYAYHLQAAWYRLGLRENGIDARFLFVLVEKTPPYPVVVAELHPEDMREGERLTRKAIDLYKQCVDTDTWPGYGDGIHQIMLPAWALPDDMEISV